MLLPKPFFILLCYVVCCFCLLVFLRYNWQVSTSCVLKQKVLRVWLTTLLCFTYFMTWLQKIFTCRMITTLYLLFKYSLWAPDSAISLFHEDVLQVPQSMPKLISWPLFQTHLNYYLLRTSLFPPFEHNYVPLYLMPTLPGGFHLHVTPLNMASLTLSNRLFINTLYFSSEPIGQDHLQLYIYLWAFCSLLTSLLWG